MGHHISTCGIEADGKKADHIINWPIPKSATDVRHLLGLVRYLADFLPAPAEYTSILTELTTNESERKFPTWTDCYHQAFEAIKSIVVSRECLTTIDLTKMPEYKIFMTTDASDKCSGAILSFGKSWASACPVAFDSMTFKGAELNYPVYEKELLVIIRALKKWRVDLLGSPFSFTQTTRLCKILTHKKICHTDKHDGWSSCPNTMQKSFMSKGVTTWLLMHSHDYLATPQQKMPKMLLDILTVTVTMTLIPPASSQASGP